MARHERSAACASGEEPYSVAMLLRHQFPDLPPNRVILHATDINSHVLARAESAVDSEWSFRDPPEWVKPAFFHRQPNGRYQLQDAAITSCAVTGNERRYEFTGHVTLMK